MCVGGDEGRVEDRDLDPSRRTLSGLRALSDVSARFYHRPPEKLAVFTHRFFFVRSARR